MKRCRKYLLASLFACLFITLFQIGGSALELNTYTVSEADGKYTLAYPDGTHAVGDTLNDLMPLVAEGGAVLFDNVSTNSSFDLSVSSYIEGELTLLEGALMNITENASVTMERGHIRLLDGASVRIKEGKFVLSGGEIEADGGSAVLMDYSSGAVFHMCGGAVVTDTEAPSLALSLGTAIVSGGVIENTKGVAVSSTGSLYLSGSPSIRGEVYDIMTSTPPTLSYRDELLLSSVRVMYDGLFEKGRGYCLFYLANEEQTSHVTLFDRNGEQYPLTYFDSASFCSERRFLGVGMPFTVRMMLGGEELFCERVYLGDRVQEPPPPETKGYSFRGWYTDISLENPYDFSAPASEDLVLYGKRVLDSPSFALHSLSFTYDGEVHRLLLSELSHPLRDDGYFSYEWYRNGELLDDSSAQLPIKSVGDSGEYYVRLSFIVGNDCVTVTTPAVTVTVLPVTVEIPEIDSKVYTGYPLRADIYDNAIFRVTQNEGGTSVGEYSVALALVDGENYRFRGADGGELLLTFQITRAENAWVSAPSVKDTYEGATPSLTAHARFGTPEILYATGADGPFSEQAPSAIGEYVAKISVPKSENYEGIAPVYLTFRVLPVYATGLRIASAPKKSAYIAFERFESEGIVAYVSYCDGSVKMISAGALEVEYLTNQDSLAFGDTSVQLAFEGVRASVSVSVSRAAYSLDGFSLDNGEHIYNGEWTTLTPTGILPTGLDGHRLTYTLTGGEWRPSCGMPWNRNACFTICRLRCWIPR